MEVGYSVRLEIFRLMLKKEEPSCIAQRAQNAVTFRVCLFASGLLKRSLGGPVLFSILSS
jgi:hypothetical protein